MTYCNGQDVYDFTNLSTTEVGTAAMGTILRMVDSEINQLTGKIFTGIQQSEHAGRGDGTSDTFYVAYKPMLSAPGGTTTDTSTHATITVDNTAVAAANYSVDGDEGMITFDSATIPDSDEKVEVTYTYSLEPVQMAAILLAASYCHARTNKPPEAKEPSWYRQRAKDFLATFMAQYECEWSRS